MPHNHSRLSRCRSGRDRRENMQGFVMPVDLDGGMAQAVVPTNIVREQPKSTDQHNPRTTRRRWKTRSLATQCGTYCTCAADNRLAINASRGFQPPTTKPNSYISKEFLFTSRHQITWPCHLPSAIAICHRPHPLPTLPAWARTRRMNV